MKHSKAVRVCSILLIVTTIFSIVAQIFLFKKAGVNVTDTSDFMHSGIFAFIVDAVTLAGAICGLALANKKSLPLVVIAGVVMVLNCWDILSTGFGGVGIGGLIGEIVVVIVPISFLYYSWMNYAGK